MKVLCGCSTLSQAAFTCSKSTIVTLEQYVKSILKLTIKTPEWCHWPRSGAFVVNFKQISHITLLFPLLVRVIRRVQNLLRLQGKVKVVSFLQSTTYQIHIIFIKKLIFRAFARNIWVHHFHLSWKLFVNGTFIYIFCDCIREK